MRRALMLATSIASLVLVVTACSGDPADDATAASPSGASSPSPTDSETHSETHSGTPSGSFGRAGWTYLALGDSNVYGAADDCGSCTTYPHLLQRRISASTKSDVTLVDASQHNQLTAQALLDEIRNDDWGDNPDPMHQTELNPREAIAAADLITITVAANDIPWYADDDPCKASYGKACVQLIEKTYAESMEQVLAQIQRIRAGKPTAVRVTTFYNDLVKGPGFDPAWFYEPEQIAQGSTTAHTFLDTWNRDLCAAARRHRAACVDTYHAANGSRGVRPLPAGFFSAQYGDLNQKGHDLFARAIIRQGFAPLA